jgi:hypothetical protein
MSHTRFQSPPRSHQKPYPQGDSAIHHRYQAPVGDGDAVRVARQILEHLVRSSEGPLGVNHPCDLAGPIAHLRRRRSLRAAKPRWRSAKRNMCDRPPGLSARRRRASLVCRIFAGASPCPRLVCVRPAAALSGVAASRHETHKPSAWHSRRTDMVCLLAEEAS